MRIWEFSRPSISLKVPKVALIQTKIFSETSRSVATVHLKDILEKEPSTQVRERPIKNPLDPSAVIAYPKTWTFRLERTEVKLLKLSFFLSAQ